MAPQTRRSLTCPAIHPPAKNSPLTFPPTLGQEQHSEATVGFVTLQTTLPEKKRTFFGEFSLCLSRACLGKMIIFSSIINGQKDRFGAPFL
jgi:hypothetical protein